MASLKILSARESPDAARLITSSARTSLMPLAAAYRRASEAALAYVSVHPRCPQAHHSPSGNTGRWPSSPALPVAPACHLTSRDHGRRDTSAQCDEEDLLQAFASTQLELGQPGGPHVVVQDHRQADCVCHDLAYGQLPPAEVSGVDGDPFLRVYEPGDHQANRSYSRGLRCLRSQLGDRINGRCDDGLRAEVSGCWPVAAKVFTSIRIEEGGLDGGAPDVDSNDKVTLNGNLIIARVHSGHVKKAGPTASGAVARRD